MMVGATQAHILVAGNLFSGLREKLKGRACHIFVADGKVATLKGNYRYPDVAVDRGRLDPTATSLLEPHLVCEVLSKGTHWIDTTRKLEDYKTIPSMQHGYSFVAQERYSGTALDADGDWRLQEFEGAEAVIMLSHFAVELHFADIYEGLAIGA